MSNVLCNNVEREPSDPSVRRSSLKYNPRRPSRTKQLSSSSLSISSTASTSTSSFSSRESSEDSSRRLRFLLQQERRTQRLPSLQESSSLNNLARMHAMYMAENQKLESAFSNQDELQFMLNCPASAAGENVQADASPLHLHMSSLKARRALLLSPLFNEYGVGVARGKDGLLYMCQLFRQR